MAPPRIRGLVLAAGAGVRFGGPKALAFSDSGSSWLEIATRMLRSGGCADVLIALGAGADEARSLVPSDASILIVEDWAEGLGATLRAGLVAAARGVDAVVVTPVDTPDAPSRAVSRVIAAAAKDGRVRVGLVQAVYGGRLGHPVLIGADRVPEIVGELHGDRGARAAMSARGVVEVECADLWSGADVDHR
ncbi:NTP transferase domain-containing protein [Microbacterium sp. P02]|uniref:nucleotidyltransferase family protein n=1 Tax=Microbacterium sp. P02 TaxID=3366260 RepID=UPI00366D5E4A